ncbi:hypothetical protein HPG69_008172 [Diceros bicornis minor]|uniref:Uncharacterized protein n=1 Tax=Diceros bicornis minor TaxID=77932 RepID=A0A7J7E6Y9_DICBM|nr:hypothetical protein HPG69_008172 [Diceros bicornis minor]
MQGRFIVTLRMILGVKSLVLLLLWDMPGSLPHFCCDPFFTEKLNSFSDLDHGHVHAEPICLQLDNILLALD